MKFKTNAVVTGAKSYNNSVDGVLHNFTKIYVMTEFGDSGFGAATVEYKWGTSENCKKIQDLSFPLECEIQMELVTNGNKQMTIVHDVLPVNKSLPK